MSAPVEMHWPEPAESTVYVVDDDPIIVRTLTRFLTGLGYPVRGFENPLEARSAIEEESPHLLLTDKDMPGLNGVELGQAAIEEDPDTAVILLTGAADVESATEALRLGLSDYLLKPPDLQKIEETVNRHLRKRAQNVYAREMEAWRRSELEAKGEQPAHTPVAADALSALVRLLERRSEHLKGHSEAVSKLAARMAEELDLPEQEVTEIRIAGLLHDMGAIAAPDTILYASGGLTGEERKRVKAHAEVAEAVLSAFPTLDRVSAYVCGHHERLDGSGYPKGLTGEDIPLGAQVVGVADAYQSMIEQRAFMDAVLPGEALSKLKQLEGTKYSSQALDALDKALG
jgi:response regulator RpfG family c-di-GMP phosphodiesterase